MPSTHSYHAWSDSNQGRGAIIDKFLPARWELLANTASRRHSQLTHWGSADVRDPHLYPTLAIILASCNRRVIRSLQRPLYLRQKCLRSWVATVMASHVIALSSFPQSSNFNQSPKGCTVEPRLQLPVICMPTLLHALLLNTLDNCKQSWLQVTVILRINGVTTVNQ